MKKITERPPVVFLFQPTEFRVLESPKEIQNWEKLMKEEVGIRADLKNISGTCTESSSAGQADDCDQD